MALRKLRYFRHVTRRGGFNKEIMQGAVEGKSRRGRPMTSWFDDISQWTGLSVIEAAGTATDRGGGVKW